MELSPCGGQFPSFAPNVAPLFRSCLGEEDRNVTPPRQIVPELEELTRLFHETLLPLGRFEEVEQDQMPLTYRQLLAHDHHMTVTVENHYGEPVRVEVLQRRSDQNRYAREILLRLQNSGQVVQYGIMRVDLEQIPEPGRKAIRSEQVPLGRVLIQHVELRQVRLDTLYRIQPGARLARLLELPPGRIIYGRTALICLNGHPAVELLEVVK